MADLRVVCITKQQHQNPYEGITRLGGSNWNWTRQQVITSIEDKTNTFHTLVNGSTAYVGVVNDPNGKYLRTHADGTWNDNLLALPACPVA